MKYAAYYGCNKLKTEFQPAKTFRVKLCLHFCDLDVRVSKFSQEIGFFSGFKVHSQVFFFFFFGGGGRRPTSFDVIFLFESVADNQKLT